VQTGARQTISSFLDATLDNRYVRWAGGLLFLASAARAALDIISGDPVAALTLSLLATGVFLLAAPYVEPLIHRDRRRGRDGDGDRKVSTESEQRGHVGDAHPTPTISSEPAPRETGTRRGVQSTAPISIDSGNRCDALKKLFVEGRRMQKAATPFSAMTGLASLQSPPTEAQIDRWQGRVRAALPPAHKRRFRFAPLEREANESPLYAMASIGAAFESKASKRLKASVDELQRIMDDLDCP